MLRLTHVQQLQRARLKWMAYLEFPAEVLRGIEVRSATAASEIEIDDLLGVPRGSATGH